MATLVTPIPAAPLSVDYVPPTSSQTGQVNVLNQSGESLSEIAAILGVSMATVDSDLGIPAPEAASVAIPAQTPVAQTAAAGSKLSVFA